MSIVSNSDIWGVFRGFSGVLRGYFSSVFRRYFSGVFRRYFSGVFRGMLPFGSILLFSEWNIFMGEVEVFTIYGWTLPIDYLQRTLTEIVDTLDMLILRQWQNPPKFRNTWNNRCHESSNLTVMPTNNHTIWKVNNRNIKHF